MAFLQNPLLQLTTIFVQECQRTFAKTISVIKPSYNLNKRRLTIILNNLCQISDRHFLSKIMPAKILHGFSVLKRRIPFLKRGDDRTMSPQNLSNFLTAQNIKY